MEDSSLNSEFGNPTDQQQTAEFAPKLEVDVKSEVRDLFNPNTIQEFSDKLKNSNGKAFFLVHPFFVLQQASKNYVSEVMRGEANDSELKRFWTETSAILHKLKAAKVPIVIMQEVPDRGSTTIEDEDKITREYQNLLHNLEAINNEADPSQEPLSAEDFFVIYTEPGGPHPLRSKEEEKLETKDFLKNRMAIIKNAGLKVGIVGGSYVKPSQGKYHEYYPSADDRYETDWDSDRKSYQSLYGEWNLKYYYDQKRTPSEHPHPLQVVRLDHCAGEFMRMLAYADMQPAISRVTYPDIIDVASNFDPVEYSGQQVFKRKGPENETLLINQYLDNLESDIHNMVVEFGIKPIPNINYDSFADEKIFIADNPVRVAEVQIQLLTTSAINKAEKVLQTFGLKVPKYDAQTGEQLTQNERLQICRQRVAAKVEELRQNGRTVPEADPLTGRPLRNGSLRQLELAS